MQGNKVERSETPLARQPMMQRARADRIPLFPPLFWTSIEEVNLVLSTKLRTKEKRWRENHVPECNEVRQDRMRGGGVRVGLWLGGGFCLLVGFVVVGCFEACGFV